MLKATSKALNINYTTGKKGENNATLAASLCRISLCFFILSIYIGFFFLLLFSIVSVCRTSKPRPSPRAPPPSLIYSY